jgi:hypothetical protein
MSAQTVAELLQRADDEAQTVRRTLGARVRAAELMAQDVAVEGERARGLLEEECAQQVESVLDQCRCGGRSVLPRVVFAHLVSAAGGSPPQDCMDSRSQRAQVTEVRCMWRWVARERVDDVRGELSAEVEAVTRAMQQEAARQVEQARLESSTQVEEVRASRRASATGHPAVAR